MQNKLIDDHKIYILPKAFLIIFLVILFSNSYSLLAQNTQVIQVKTFTESLQPYPNLSISINNRDFTDLNEKAVIFINLPSDEIPIKSIKLKDELLEVASWNLSKGTLEVIIRKKSYIDKKIKVIDVNDNILVDLNITYNGKKSITKQTDQDGYVTIPLGLNERIESKNQFVIENFDIISFRNLETPILTIKKVEIANSKDDSPIPENNVRISQASEQISSQSIDTLSNLISFYNLLNTIRKSEIDTRTQARLDSKFNELLSRMNNGSSNTTNELLNEISDSTIVQEDIDILLEQARSDNKEMSRKRIILEDKIQIVRDKLNVGFENMTEESKESLLSEIEALEILLKENKDEFNENLNSYLTVITELKRRFFDLQELESKLTESEKERLKEKKLYQERLLITFGVVFIFSLLIILLFYFRARLKKQKQALIEANKVVKLTNENLENIVSERTYLLNKTFKELDTVLYKASHDLRAPLSSIAGISNLINRETNNVELTNLLFKTNNRMDKLLKKLSTVSEIHQPGQFEEIIISDIVTRIMDSFQELIKERNIDFNLQIDVPKNVLSISKLVEVSIYHLIENALYFSWVDNNQQPRVELNIQLEDNALKIKVSDNGVGVDKNIEPKLFEMFHVGSEYSDGNGLGLYIVQKSAELLNGKVYYENSPDGLTTFTVILPIDGKGSNTLEYLGSLNHN
ncbi:sensor histidine kinase [Marivirga arenosa]|uniref:histidine kinase n=1 Tax=Marivirga arenosa TaxID=3059076 RepID=A0AA51X415_9BACT|nr:ATP-binding protein [Marivirga sp. BKB1-2]WNB16940.1 ATP-binding protein [Marivirga sp. BKB1-2]